MKKIITIIPTDDDTEPYTRQMTNNDAEMYHRTATHTDLKLGEYCENCSILIGDEYMNKRPLFYKTFYVCIDCKKQLKDEVELGRQLSVPNLNDL